MAVLRSMPFFNAFLPLQLLLKIVCCSRGFLCVVHARQTTAQTETKPLKE